MVGLATMLPHIQHEALEAALDSLVAKLMTIRLAQLQQVLFTMRKWHILPSGARARLIVFA